MAGHFPFSGNGGRGTAAAFYERYRFNDELQEQYYKWWYDWAKNFVENDPALATTKGVDFVTYPYGQHAHRAFHLNNKVWPVLLSSLGEFIKGTLLPRLSEQQLHALEAEHTQMLDALRKAAQAKPREPSPDVGYFRHT